MLSPQEQHAVVRVLGWTGKVIQENSTAYNSQVYDRVSNITTEMEDEARTLLERIAKLDAKLETALCRVSVKEVDGIKLNSEMELMQLRKERKRLIMELSDLLDIPYVGSSSGMVNVVV